MSAYGEVKVGGRFILTPFGHRTQAWMLTREHAAELRDALATFIDNYDEAALLRIAERSAPPSKSTPPANWPSQRIVVSLATETFRALHRAEEPGPMTLDNVRIDIGSTRGPTIVIQTVGDRLYLIVSSTRSDLHELTHAQARSIAAALVSICDQIDEHEARCLRLATGDR